jgi:hypothetical protein
MQKNFNFNDENRRIRIRIHNKMSWIRNTADKAPKKTGVTKAFDTGATETEVMHGEPRTFLCDTG